MVYSPTPNVTAASIERQRDGWIARVDCVLDGFPGEVEIQLDDEHRRYSSATVQVFDPVRIAWSQVYSMPKGKIQDLPILADTPEGLAQLNALAMYLYSIGTYILAKSRVRQNEVDAETAAAEEMAKITVRDAHYAKMTEELLDETLAAKQADNVTVTVDGEDLPVDVVYKEGADK